MAKVKVYVNDEQISEEVASDMLSMTGWSDTEETTYCNITNKEINPVSLRLDSDKYIAYFGDEFITLAISTYRNVTVALNVKEFELNTIPDFDEVKKFDYAIKKLYLSSRVTEYENDLINLKITKYDNDWIYLFWGYENSKFEAYISVDL